MRSVIFDINYVPHFSGHETFPLRQMWLKKAFDAVSYEKKGVFSSDDAIVTFGVGKNMVGSIRHWALACGIIESKSGGHIATDLGKKIFANDGLDPYCEHYATSWLMHWNLAGRTEAIPRATTWYWVFNHLSEQSFSAKQVKEGLIEYLDEKTPRIKVSENSLDRDIEVFLRSYVPKSRNATMEDIAEPMLGELGLIQMSTDGLYEFRRGAKSTLPDEVFLYALIEFWKCVAPNQNTLSFESIAYDPGSPGRVFKLDENSIAERLISLEAISHRRYVWSDTAGLRHVVCVNGAMSPIDVLGSKA
ncbi:MAG: DUF4007 family protein [Gallionella sp.]|nr:DUF4007 family protein [Gallionella sp.]MDD4947411.1 DUF4007 family protein [Gallionella sp.]